MPMRPPLEQTASQSRLLACVGLFVLGLLAHAPGLENSFVSFDDLEYIVSNQQVRQGLTLSGLEWAFTSQHASNWHPLTWLSHMLDVELFGNAAWGHHLTGILLHCGSVLLLFSALVRMTGAFWRSLLAAALLAVHPVHVESVAWASERKDELSLFLGLLCIHAYIAYARRPGFGLWLLTAFLLALGLLAKPMLVTLPCLLLLLDWWPLGRWRRAPMQALPKVKQQSALWLCFEKLPLFGITLLSSTVTLSAQTNAMVNLDYLSFSQRLINAFESYMRYIYHYTFPINLSFFYKPDTPSVDAGFFLSLAFLILITTATVVFARRLPWLVTGWLWFLGSLIPVIGIVQVGGQAMADRYLYLPGIGLAIIVSWGLASLCRQGSSRLLPRICAVFALLAIVLLTLQTRDLTTKWEDSKTLGEYGLQQDARNYMAHMLLGWHYYYMQEDMERAFMHYHAAQVIRPGFTTAVLNAASSLMRQEKHSKTIEFLLPKVEDYHRVPRIFIHLAYAYEQLGEREKAMSFYERVLELEPQQSFARRRLNVLRQHGTDAP